MPEKFQGNVTRVRVAPVADEATFDPATALAGAFPLYVRSVDPSIGRDTFAFDKEMEDEDGDWGEGEATTERNWSISFDGYFHPDDSGYQTVENAAWRENEAGVVQGEIVYVWYFPTGNLAGAKFYHGFSRPEELGIPSDRGGSVDSSYALNGKGKLNRARVA